MRTYGKIAALLAVGCLFLVIGWNWYGSTGTDSDKARKGKQLQVRDVAVEPKMERQETNAARYDYYFRLLRDPATNSIPENIRARELAFARTLPVRTDRRTARFRSNTQAVAGSQYNWYPVGPEDVGGRTRALGVDRRNPDIVIAGGVSGGIWKSIDGGDTWQLKSDPTQHMSVTSLVQDPTAPDTWYYASGEFLGNSTTDQGGIAPYRGTGVFKSTDNGETWNRLAATEDTDISYNSPFDYISRIIVSPATGSVFIASNGFGIYRSADGGSSWSNSALLGGGKQFVDINTAPDGRLVGVVSTTGSGSGQPGVFLSVDDGANWTEVTPATFPASHQRSVTAFAPSDPGMMYLFTYKGSGDNQAISFHKFTLNEAGDDTLSTEDRSSNIPDFGEQVGGINVQGGYNMVVQVKPDDPDYVFVGGINLFRSEDGFATGPANSADSTKAKYWIGGYNRNNDVSLYPAHHPDQHIIAFHPTMPDTVWSGHDGGLSRTFSITDSVVSWENRDNGYITSQFYSVAVSQDTVDATLVGGTQDNGSPFFNIDENFQQSGGSADASSGDGGYAFFGQSPLNTLMYTSSQLGRTLRFDLQGNTYTFNAFVHPAGAQNQLFIHPYAIDPNDGGIMYYPGVSGNTPQIWVNTATDEISTRNSSGATDGWSAVDLTDASGQGYQVTALEVSRRPADILYFGAYSNSGVPRIYKATDASGDFTLTDISIPDAASGAYVHDIALNPVDADEAIVVFSNYGVTGIYRTVDGGSSWTAIEGNLSSDADGNADEGPSIRSAVIMPTGESTIYMVGTSVGLYSTEILDGANTTWMQESAADMGNAVVAYLAQRFADGTIVAGSHGRGIYFGEFTGTISSPGSPAPPTNLAVNATETGAELSWTTSFSVDVTGYKIYRGRQSTGLALLDSVGNRNSASDETIGSETYYYAVSAVDNEGLESPLTYPVAAFREVRQIDGNWNLVGSPMVAAGEAGFPSEATLFGFDGVYTRDTRMEPGQGYWIKPKENSQVEYLGGAPTLRTVSLQSGWNMIAGVGDTTGVSRIQDPDSILTATPVQEFTGSGYQDAQQLVPTGGYFIHAQEKGEVVIAIDTAGGQARSYAGYNAPVDLQRLDRLIFSRQGVSRPMFVSREKLTPVQKEFFLVPPRSPAMELDIRTADGYRLADGEKTELNLGTEQYPVSVRLSLPEPGESARVGSYRLIGINNGEEVYFELGTGSSEVTIDRPFDRLYLVNLQGQEIPLTNELLPNYPNPFNPTTTIEYQVASKVLVTMDVYNLVGRKVRTLVNGVQNPGRYRVNFDGSGLSSGIYFVRIEAGPFQKVQKMTLIK